MHTAPAPASDSPPTDEDLAQLALLEGLEEVLDELNQRRSVPEWEFCEGFMTAMLCARRPPADEQWLPVLLGAHAHADANTGAQAGKGADGHTQTAALFDSEGQRTRFMMGWLQRQAQIRTALQAQVNDLQDPRALCPSLLDWRALQAGLQEGGAQTPAPPAASATPASGANQAPPGQAGGSGHPRDADAGDADTGNEDAGAVPSYAQLWALGFMAAVAQWPEDWAPPRDKDIAAQMADALDCVALLTHDDSAAPAHNMHDSGAAPTTSEQRLQDLCEALWAVYDLHAIGRALGPPTRPATRASTPGRNDPCPCGSGRKYKKCCGA